MLSAGKLPLNKKFLTYFGITLIVFIVAFLLIDRTKNRVVEANGYLRLYTTINSVERGECSLGYDVTQDSSDCYKLGFTDPDGGDKVQVEVGANSFYVRGGLDIKEGSAILVNKFPGNIDTDYDTNYQFAGFERSKAYLVQIFIFAVVVLLITGTTGFRSLLALGVSIFAIGFLIVSPITKGYDPIIAASVGGFIMVSILVYISHGFHKLSTISILGIGTGILISILFAFIFSQMSYITGFADESATYLAYAPGLTINIRRLVIASFIMGSLGVVDDATVSQTYVVAELKRVNSKLKPAQLFRSAMRVGSSHVGSLINTLFLAYVAASLPMIVLMYTSNPGLQDLLNYDIFAEEIARTLVGSLGLIVSIPATTLFAVWLIKEKDLGKTEHTHEHDHTHGHSHNH